MATLSEFCDADISQSMDSTQSAVICQDHIYEKAFYEDTPSIPIG